jgi:hypothetical protein
MRIDRVVLSYEENEAPSCPLYRADLLAALKPEATARRLGPIRLPHDEWPMVSPPVPRLGASLNPEDSCSYRAGISGPLGAPTPVGPPNGHS